MESSRRLILALALSVAVMFGVQFLFPPAKETPGAKAGRDITTHAPAVPVTPESARAPTAAAATPPRQAVSAANPVPAPVVRVPADTTLIQSTTPRSGSSFRIGNLGAAPIDVVMRGYPNQAHGGLVRLGGAGRPLISYQLVTTGQAPVDLAGIPFQKAVARNAVTYSATVGGTSVALEYRVVPDSFTAHVTGTVTGTGGARSYLVVQLPNTMPITEADTADDLNYLAYAYLSRAEGARNVLFHSLDPGEKKLVEGPITWVAAKSKYFAVGIIAPAGSPGFAEADLTGGPRTSKVATTASASVAVPVRDGRFAFDLYVGPQEWKRLAAIGRDFTEVNPYGWAFLRGALQPLAAGVIQTVLWMHSELGLGYGWVLILLGVVVRLVMWPLYQTSMRTSLKMQAMQPEINAVNARYKDDPERQRIEVMKVYQSHGMSPFSPVMGCLPSLLPMPVLFALFFVFKNTIEFRGVSFLWLPNLAAHDPYYILPLIMGVSMYLVSWVGMRGMPPNPQAKMMTYAMPAIFTMFFWRMASGLNLYYATQNLAALPQQWHLTRERAKMGAAKPGDSTPPAKAPSTKVPPATGRAERRPGELPARKKGR